jgi:RimJ/RimL family protein N-acetyltransferase
MANEITIEPLAPAYFGVVAKWLSVSENTRWLTSEFRGRTVEPVTMGIFVRNPKNKFFLIRVAGEAAAVAGLADFDQTDHIAMVWYALGEKKFAGKGVTSEGVRQMSLRAFQELGVRSLYAWIMEDNTPSRRVLEKCGFREAGRIRSGTCSGIEQRDRVYFDLVPADLGL